MTEHVDMTSARQTQVVARHRSLMVWAALGFAVGSVLFVVGVPLSMDGSLPPAVGGWTFFVGSVFFTAAGTLQVVDARRPVDEPLGSDRHRWSRTDRLDLLAALVQWVGTVAFNVTTLRGALDAASRASYDSSAVWRPDAVGSVLFLVASAAALAPEVRWRRHQHARDRSWAIAAVNLLGSVFFGISAVGAWTDPSTGELVSLTWSNVGTVLGGLCFLVGAVLLFPRSAR